MSFREIALTVRAVNRASGEFTKIQADAQTLATRVKSLGSTLAGLGAAGTAVGYVANQFGILNDAQMRVFNSAMMVVTVMGTFLRTSTGLAVAQKIYSAACSIATAAQNALNISYGTFLALTGVGIVAIAAATVAMWSLANSMNNATASVANFNNATVETPAQVRSIQRSGETAVTSRNSGSGSSVASFYRRGVE